MEKAISKIKFHDRLGVGLLGFILLFISCSNDDGMEL